MRMYNVLRKHKNGGETVKLKAFELETMIAERGMTKSDFAKVCGISRQNISTIIRRGTCNPTTAVKLANGLNVNVRDIIAEEV